MEGKRENIKKALGITEYPWSSDDEDHDPPPLPTTTNPDVSVMPMSLTCTSGPTATNTSSSIRGSMAGLPLVSSSVRRSQAPSRIERNLFWSLLCNPEHVEVVSRPPRCTNEGPQRQQPVRPNPVTRPAPEALLRPHRTSPLREIRGLLAYKKATRYVPNRRPRPMTSINVNRSPGHVVLPTRNPLFGAGQPMDPRIRRAQGDHSGEPSTSSVYGRPSTCLNRCDDDAQPSTSSGVTQRLYDIDHTSRPVFSIDHSSRHEGNIDHSSRREGNIDHSSRREGNIDHSSRHEGNIDHNSRHEGNIDHSSRHEGNIDHSSRHEGNIDHSSRHEGNIDHSSRHEGNIEECMVLDQDSDDEMDSTPQRSKDDTDQTPENINDETVQREGVSLEEEVLVVGVEEQPSAINATDGDVNPDAENGNPPASSTPNIQQDDGSQSPKRKIPNDEEFKELNTNLLRLLECPVCMEWMEPPMSQCRRGHLVCVKCRARLSSCPVCRTTFSSVRNRAMEGVAEMLRYPCRHGCGREVRLRRRTSHEANCPLRRYACPSPCCSTRAPLPTHHLHHHLQTKHPSMLKIGRKQKFTVKLNAEQHDNFVLMCFHELFHLKIDVDIRTWGLTIYAAYIGPKKTSKSYIYEVAIDGKHNGRKIIYSRTTHSDLESASLNVSRHDCFHLSISQALNFLRVKNRHFEADNTLNVGVTISQNENEDMREDSDS